MVRLRPADTDDSLQTTSESGCWTQWSAVGSGLLVEALARLSCALLVVAVGLAVWSCQDVPSLEGTLCSSARPCGEGMTCLGQRCSRLTVGPTFCESDSDCQSGAFKRFCYSAIPDVPGQPSTYVDNFCVNCFTDSHCNVCNDDEVCANAVCLTQPGGLSCIGCYDHTHCETGLCQGNNICRSCNPDIPANGGCPAGSTCVDGSCKNCADDKDCETNLCVSGVCRICVSDDDCCSDNVSCDRVCVDRTCEEV